uniref:WD domain, G-beta repeat containing protein n=1 Tax=Babesia bovis TaxID=5865 RepID=A7AQU5_BABBO|eukprot:XP_001610482.1 WD domain, G-beta repeat containing protein [Babesia bovis T2Bo]
MNILDHLQGRRRALDVGSGLPFRVSSIDDPSVPLGPLYARKLKHYSRLDVHRGCVNRLRWHVDGNILASVSDDLTIALTNVHESDASSVDTEEPMHSQSTSIPTDHTGNIFGVAFLDRGFRIATGARDSKVCINDVHHRRSISCYSCHRGSVKQILNDHRSDFVFYSAGYDGTVRQFDVREHHHCERNCRNVIINMSQANDRRLVNPLRRKHSWATVVNGMAPAAASAWVDTAYRESQWAAQAYDGTEVKAIALNPVQPELLAVAASDTLVRVFDRRKLSLGHASNDGISVNFTMPILDQIYMPKHFWSDQNNKFATYLAWSPNGERLAVTYEGEHVYLFDRHFNSVGGIDVSRSVVGVCNFDVEDDVDHLTFRIRDMETHYAKCYDVACAQRNLPRLIYLLLYRDHMGDALLCETMARAAFSLNPQDPVLLFRRIQANLRLDNYYLARTLCTRGARLFPRHANDFIHIRNLCLLLSNKDRLEGSSHQITTALKSICSSRHITSPKTDLGLKDMDESSNHDSDGSDDDFHCSNFATFRYSIACWRRWPKPETCLEIDEHLRASDSDIHFDDSASEPDSDDESHTLEFSHQMTMDNQNTFTYSVRGTMDYPPADRMLNMHHYFSYDAPEMGSHDYRQDLLYEQYPIPYMDEHALYKCIEAPSWRPRSGCLRFWGHCNFGTDIAEVNFWGNDVLVSGSADGTVYLYDVDTGHILDIIKAHNENVNCVQVNSQGTLLATSGIDHHIQVWSPYGELNRITVGVITRA